MMNKSKLTALIHRVSKEKNVTFNILLQVYFFERFLYRLASSKYKDSLILKGGFLLSSLLGITERSTIDMDFSVSSMKFNKENMKDTIYQIIQMDLKDNISFQITGISEITEQSTYVGYRISLIGNLENIKVPFHIDLATGDPITPNQITHKYQSMIEGNAIEIKSYTVETVLAEKLQTVMDKRIGNSRMKDFYDIYLLMKLYESSYDNNVLNTAIKTTFDYRNTTIDKEEFKDLLDVLDEDIDFVSRWNTFTKKNHYVEKINFKEVKTEVLNLIDFID